MRNNAILEIPGVKEAIERDQLIWNAAFLPIHESIAGFEVLPMNLRHYLILRMMHSPLLGNGTPTPDDLAAFLWVLNPGYAPGKIKARDSFLKTCRRFTPPAQPLVRNRWTMAGWEKCMQAAMVEAAKVLTLAREYVSETFQDRPPSSATISYEPEYYSDAAHLCAAFARDFGWDDEITLSKPMKRLFQYLKEHKHANNPNAVLFSRVDRVTGEWMSNQNGTRN